MLVLFWISVCIILYTYLGYPIVLFIFVRIKRFFKKNEPHPKTQDWPGISLIIAAYNEADLLVKKISNTIALDYPKEKLQIIIVTDGSDDGSELMASPFPEIISLHQNERKGKNAAVERALPFARHPYLVFCDANTFLNKECLKNIALHYQDKKVGGVAGEKRVHAGKDAGAAGIGEGAYWRYESTLKKWDSELYTVVGAAGELFSIRKVLMEPIPKNIIIEDFYLSMMINSKGFVMRYEPEAYAMENSSASIEEEKKRKVRIAAGGIQAVLLLLPLLNVFKYKWLSFQFFSHRVLRWTLAPLSLALAFFSNLFVLIVIGKGASMGSFEFQLFAIFMAVQILFYLLAFIGYLLRSKDVIPGLFYIPYYFSFMNVAVYLGAFRLFFGHQSAIWEKSKRAKA